ncbi:MAG: mannose-1-phosphate guanylyltransferase [Anaerolineales bacterium]
MVLNYPVFAVILAGGQGTRLWPISRRSRPKQFLDLTGNGSTMLQETVRRALELTGSLNNILVVVGCDQEALVKEQLPDLPSQNILCEPQGRNTAPGLALAAFYLSNLLQKSEDIIMVSLPVDHMFKDEGPWFLALRTAIQAASINDSLVSIGINPTAPATGYGYQQLGEAVDLDSPLPLHHVLRFVEKPSREIAMQFLESGQYLWNTGTYAWKLTVFMSALQKQVPSIFVGLESLGTPLELNRLGEIYPTLDNISIDHALMEKADNVLTVRSNFERIDVGSLESLAGVWKDDAKGNTGIGNFVSLNSTGNIVYNVDGLVTLLGVEDLVVVRTEEIILVCPRDRIQEIKNLVGDLQVQGLEEYL